MRSTFLLVRTFALTTAVAAGAAACDGGGGPSDSPGSTPTPSTVPVAAQGPDRVIVTNAADNPVKTQAVGTTTVGGTVSANQAGTWDVRVSNPTLAVEGAVQVTGGSIAASQAGAWGVTVTEPVAIAPGASVAVSSLPPVTLAGTPAVNATITGTPTVNAIISGAPAVQIANTPNVSVSGAVMVANAESDAVPVRGPTETPWVHGGSFLIPVGASSSAPAPFHVPPGKRLVVEYVDANLDLPLGQFGDSIYVNWNLALPGGGSTGREVARLPMQATQNFGDRAHAGMALMTRLYFEADQDVNFSVSRNTFTGVASASVHASGYLIDAP